MAEDLKIPQITYVSNLEIQDSKVIAERAFRSEESVVIETTLPVLISVVKEINHPRSPSIKGIVDAYDEKEVIYLDSASIGAQKERIGLN